MSNDEIDKMTIQIQAFLEANKIDPLYCIVTCASQLGWNIDVTCDESDNIVEGIAIGTKEYIDHLR
jgi:hypothetical protein